MGPRPSRASCASTAFVNAIDRGRSDLAALALEAGYADQAHLTRETTRLAGLPPAALIRARGAAGSLPPPQS
jgi:AraC-like DNA-binding protein